MFHTTAMRKRAFTSGSCGCGSRGSQKKIRKPISLGAEESAVRRFLQAVAVRTGHRLTKGTHPADEGMIPRTSAIFPLSTGGPYQAMRSPL